jgi:ribonucleoside-diphosphate reductase alpha chain
MKQPIHPVEKEKCGIIGTHAAKFTAEEKLACSIEAMRNGGECEACQ